MLNPPAITARFSPVQGYQTKSPEDAMSQAFEIAKAFDDKSWASMVDPKF